MANARYQVVNLKSIQAGVGRSFNELRTFILDTKTDKIVRDVGAAKYSQEKAASLAAEMNTRECHG